MERSSRVTAAVSSTASGSSRDPLAGGETTRKPGPLVPGWTVTPWSWREFGGAVAWASGLLVLFWWPLVCGGGLIGGDTFTYFYPQKIVLSAALADGELATWHPWTGAGYPLLAESQGGVVYPPHLVFFGWSSLFGLEGGYVANQLLHYLATFLACWLYAWRIGLSQRGRLLASLIYTYGWFPPRLCLEWAIIGGFYLPWALFLVESWWQTGRRIAVWIWAVSFGIQLTAGHFNLAWIELLAVALYPLVRGGAGERAIAWLWTPLPRRDWGVLELAAVLGFLLAAVQLVPTWELKQRSQRSTVDGQYDPGYGHLPPLYLSQLVMPWIWYSPEIALDDAIQALRLGSWHSATNKVEAHLYLGLLPAWLLIATAGWLVAQRGGLARRLVDDESSARSAALQRRLNLGWIGLSLLGIVLSSGWPLLVLRWVPGFNFFSGPGRYSILAQLGGAVLVARAWDWWTMRGAEQRSAAAASNVGLGPRRGENRAVAAASSSSRSIVTALSWWTLMLATSIDFWLVSRIVTNVFLVDPSPLAYREQSEVRELLGGGDPIRHAQMRLFAPGPNLPNLLEVSTVPVYLGIGPAEYFAAATRFPQRSPGAQGPPTADEQREQLLWCQQAAVTHVLSFTPLDPKIWPVDSLWTGYDAFLNRAWARYDEPIYLYQLRESRPRVGWSPMGPGERDGIEVASATATAWTIRTRRQQPGRLVLRELDYPGWIVTIDDQPAESHREGMFRAVDVPAGEHVVRWQYQPWSVQVGLVISAIAAVIAGGWLVWIRRRPRG